MKLNYLGIDETVKNQLDEFEDKININSDINGLFNDESIDIEFYDTFDNISELNSDNTVDIESIKDDTAFCSTQRKKIYVKKDSLHMDDDEFDFMLSHEVAHIYINIKDYYIKHYEVYSVSQNIKGNKFKEELADFLACKWGFRRGFKNDRLICKGQEYIDCFVDDEIEFADKIYKYRNTSDFR